MLKMFMNDRNVNIAMNTMFFYIKECITAKDFIKN